METGEALTGLLKLIPMVIFSIFAFKRQYTVLFMIAGGIAMITGCYMTDIINGGITDNLSLSASLGMMLYSLVCFGFAYHTLFVSEKDEGNN